MRDSDGMELFESYLRDVKRSSQNTISSYLRDIRQLSEYLHAHTDADLGSAEEEELCEYIDWMRSNGKSVATVSRAIASLKNFYGFLLNNHYVQHNPTGKLVPDKAKQKLPQILSSKEVELLLAQPECTDAKGYRDRAMLELLYATGIRVSELISLNITDVNLSAGVIRCQGRDKARMIPMYPAAVRALTEYINFIRPQMIAAPDEQALSTSAGNGCRVRASGSSSRTIRPRPASKRRSHRTRCAIPSLRICWKTARISTPFRKCSAMRTSPRRRSIRTLSASSSRMSTTKRTRVRDIRVFKRSETTRGAFSFPGSCLRGENMLYLFNWSDAYADPGR